MRSSLLLFASILALALAAACGGKTNYGPGEPGDGGSSSSGASGSSSGVGSSGSGSSSGGVTCAPLPGCSSSVECPAPGGCGSCICAENGGWTCTDCISDAFPVDDSPSSACLVYPPNNGSICYQDGLTCDYASQGGCGEQCDCQNGSWQCFSDPCPPPVCPPSAPPNQSLCSSIGATCFFPVDSGCGYEQCDCDPSGTWGCSEGSCVDEGPPDAGPPTDAGIFDAGPCPAGEPGANAPCPEDGLVCSYFNGCQANCLCTSTGWVCANEPPCK